MEIIGQLFEAIRPGIPTGVTIFLIVIVIFGVRLILEKRYAGSTGNHFRRQVITLLLTFAGLLTVIMVLPMDHERRGQLLSLIGIVITAAIALSSATLLGNIMAGIMIRTIGNFRPGNFIRVGQYFGRVSDRGLFHVEIQGEDRDLTTLPNLYLVTNPVKVIRSSGTIVSAEVSLGYDLHRGRIETILREAALGADLQEPYVHVLELGDYSVTYRVSGLLSEVKHILTVRSRLRELMLDALHKEGIEIISPTFMNTRAVPPEKRFVPGKISNLDESDDQPTPEEIVFDKADQAESIEKLREYREQLGKSITDLNERLELADNGKAKGEIQDEMDKMEMRRKRLAEVIERREKEINEKSADD